MKPDLDAIRAHYAGETAAPLRAIRDVQTLLAYIDDLEHERDGWKFNACDARDRIAMLEHMLEEERQNVDTLRARVAKLEGREFLPPINAEHEAIVDWMLAKTREGATKRPIVTHSPGETEWANRIAHAEQRFVDEYDARKAAEEWANELRTELFDWQDAVGYVLGDNWSSEDGHDAKAARKALAEWAAKAQGEAPQLLAEIAELKARIVTLEAMKP